MIPILFEKTATTFTSNGIGRLADCTRCIVTEERNGIYECEFDYPVTGSMFNEITIGRIVVCTHDEAGDVQPFDIYKVSEPINGIVTYYANHISYRLNEITVEPFTELTCSAAIAALGTNSIGTNPFTFFTDKSVTEQYTLSTPASCRGLLMGQENSLLDVYGTGEYQFDNFTVRLLVNRGADRYVTIRYGKNLIDYKDDLDYSACYNGVVPYWYGEVYDDTTGIGNPVLVTLTEKYISSGQTLPGGRLVLIPMDLSSDFSEQPTESQLRDKATSRLTASYAWMPNQNITINFVQLWQTEEYKGLAPLQQVKLCDTVLVDVPMYNVSGLRIKIIKVIWNVLLERYDEMQLGSAQATFAATIGESLDINNTITEIKQELFANSVIAGNTNQHFWFTGSGTDTGAHITEVDRETFLNDPSNGGGNLLARSNGIAVRDGTRELATFAANEIILGRSMSGHAKITDSSLTFSPSYGSSDFNYTRQSGVFVTQTHIGDGVTKKFDFFRYQTNTLTVTINGTATTAFSQLTPTSNSLGTITFTTAPANGAVIVISYTTSWENPRYSFGINTITAPYGYSEGRGNNVDGIFAHTEGRANGAAGAYAHAQNHGTMASGESQTAIGKYNVEDTNNQYALIIGNGNSTTRANALTVDWGGDVFMALGSSSPDTNITAALTALGWSVTI